MAVLDKLFVELHAMIRQHGISAGPHMHDQSAYRITYHIDFEPHGRASETWEYDWILELPWCYHHYHHMREGWKKGRNDHMATFHARSLQKVLRAATEFLIEAHEQGLRLGEVRREQTKEEKTWKVKTIQAEAEGKS